MKWLVAVALLVGGLYAGYAAAYPSHVYRYRMTIDVDTPAGVKSGASVLEVKTIQYPSWVTLGANNHSTTVRGEAVFVDLGNGRNLVALLALDRHAADGRASLFAPRSFFAIVEGNPFNVKWTRELSSMAGRRVYAGNKRPTLVTFADPKNPATVREVAFDNPQDVLGPDIRSVSAWIDLTKDPVTESLEAKLPWISRFEAAEAAWRVIRQGKGSGGAPLQIFKLRGE
jgi:hypothetical protein